MSAPGIGPKFPSPLAGRGWSRGGDRAVVPEFAHAGVEVLQERNRRQVRLGKLRSVEETERRLHVAVGVRRSRRVSETFGVGRRRRRTAGEGDLDGNQGQWVGR